MHDTPDPQSVAQNPDQHVRLRAHVGERDSFAFRTRPDLTSPDAIRPAERLLLEILHESRPSPLLVADANYGVVGTVMAAFVDDVWMTEPSVRAGGCCRDNAERNGVADRTTVAITADLRALPRQFEAAALAPRPYTPIEVGKQRLADALAALAAGGVCYVAGTPSTGLNRYERTLAELCDDVTRVAQSGDVAVLRGTRPPGYTPRWYAEPRILRPTVRGETLSLVAYPGLFSAASLDAGTRALAEQLSIDDGERVLDLCCGYGPLGVYAARTAACSVTMVDEHCVATACARRSARLSDVADAVTVVTADGTAPHTGSPVDRVLCNPPTHAGSEVLSGLLRRASEALAPGGELNLVHHHGVAVDGQLAPHFADVASVARGDYRIVRARPEA